MDSYCSAMNEKPDYKMTSFRFSGRFVEFLKSASRLTRLSQAKLIEKCVAMNLDKVLEELGREALAERARLEKLGKYRRGIHPGTQRQQRSMAKAHWAKTLKEAENRRRLERNREELIDLQSRARPTPQPPEDDDENLNNHPIEAQEGPAQKPTRPRAELKHGTNPA